MKVWDCVMLRNELDMLQLRLEELERCPAWHRTVIVEAPVTHQGKPKPLHYADNRERFSPWADQIIHVIADDLPDDPDPWVREHAQRDRALAALEDAGDNDAVLAADVDEIPSVTSLLVRPAPAFALYQRVCAFAVDWLAPFTERTSVMMTAALAREKGLAAVRYSRNSMPALKNAGWHFCWLGGRDACLEKLDAFCHLETRETVRQGLESGDFIERGLWNVARLERVNVDERWPAMIREGRCPSSWLRPRGSDKEAAA